MFVRPFLYSRKEWTRIRGVRFSCIVRLKANLHYLIFCLVSDFPWFLIMCTDCFVLAWDLFLRVNKHNLLIQISNTIMSTRSLLVKQTKNKIYCRIDMAWTLHYAFKLWTHQSLLSWSKLLNSPRNNCDLHQQSLLSLTSTLGKSILILHPCYIYTSSPGNFQANTLKLTFECLSTIS